MFVCAPQVIRSIITTAAEQQQQSRATATHTNNNSSLSRDSNNSLAENCILRELEERERNISAKAHLLTLPLSRAAATGSSHTHADVLAL